MIWNVEKYGSGKEVDLDRIVHLLNVTYNFPSSEYFIYKDAAYLPYLRFVLSSESQMAYLLTDERRELCGFAHLKIAGSTVFVINVIIKAAYRNAGLGTKLLLFALKDILERKANVLVRLRLDVFKSNSKALNLYLRWGLKIEATSYRYQIPAPELSADDSTFYYKTDGFGFTQLYQVDTAVGYLINNTKLVLKENFKGKLSEIPQPKPHTILSACLISLEPKPMPLLDQSFSMCAPFRDMISALSQITAYE